MRSRRPFILAALLASLLACGQEPTKRSEVGLAAVTVRAGAGAVQASSLRPTGVPTGTTLARLSVFQNDAEVFFDPSGHIAAGGSRPTITVPGGAPATVYLPTGYIYDFHLTALDGQDHQVGFGERADIQVTTTTAQDVDISMRSFVGGVSLTGPTSIKPGAQATLLLKVHPDACTNLTAPHADWDVTYLVTNGTIARDANGRELFSQLGVTVVANANASGSVKVAAVVNGLKGPAPGSIGDTTGEASMPVTGSSTGGVGADMNPPTVTIDSPTNLQVGQATTLTGTATDDRGIDHVAVFAGIVELGNAAVVGENWSIAFTPTASEQVVTAIAFDMATNTTIAERTVTATEGIQTSGLDATFAGDGMASLDGLGAGLGTRLALQADGKIVVAGKIGSGIPGQDLLLARLNPDGTLDTAFDGDGSLRVNLGHEEVAQELLLSTTGINVLGEKARALHIARYPSAGGEPSVAWLAMGSDTMAASVAGGVQLTGGGLLVVGGYSGSTALTRVTPQGALDAGFDYDGTLLRDFVSGAEGATSVAVQSGDRVVVAVQSAPASGPNQVLLARITNTTWDYKFAGTGTAVTTAAELGGTKVTAKRVVVLPGDSIVTVGEVFKSGGSDVLVERRTASGGLDSTFGSNGRAIISFGTFDYGNAVVVDLGGRLYVVGNTTAAQGTDPYGDGKAVVARLTPAGQLDTTFGNGGKLILSQEISASHAVLDADGRLLITGRGSPVTGGYAIGVARIKP